MHLFALQTDTDQFKQTFLHEGEQEVMTIRHHGFKFVIAASWLLLLTLAFIALATGIIIMGVAWWIATPGAVLAWLIAIFPRLLSAYIDWRYDFTFVTTDKVVMVDQTSLFRQRITPINLENFAGVSTETQFLNLFPFGKLHFHLKSGVGQDVILPYVEQADKVAAAIANAVTEFQRRKDLRRHGEP